MKLSTGALDHRAWVLVTAAVLLGILAALYATSRQTEQVIVLLVPNKASFTQPVTQAWMGAAREEGLPVVAMTDDEFLRYGGNRSAFAGVILPDSVHQRASDLLVNLLHTYVEAGGSLFIAFDAALLDANDGTYAAGQSRLSPLAGVRYALYNQLRSMTYAKGPVYGSRESESRLGIQPGKLDFTNSSLAPLGELTTYGYERLEHSFFRTEGGSGATTLLRSAEDDVIVGENRFGKGSVLFANLPLGYLKTRTDGYLLHRLLRHFAIDMLRQPHLAPVPNAKGGLVLNLHIDSNAAQAPLLELEKAGWFDEGPFSLHVTAGPDASRVGDGLGLNLDANGEMQAFFKRQVARGHEVGNHGGWIHNVFGEQANETNRNEFEPFLELNNRSITPIVGKAVRSYSAPMGNQPVWATRWLHSNGFQAHYFTGDVGLGPTRSFYDGKRPASAIWAFPVSNFLKIATFEELDSREPPLEASDIALFLTSLSRYVADYRVARLFYFHPPASTRYASALDIFMTQARELTADQRFRWYTMEGLAAFLNRREQAHWRIIIAANSSRSLVASSTTGLQELSWVFPRSRSMQFRVVQGNATLRQEGDEWIVTAGDCTTLEVQMQ